MGGETSGWAAKIRRYFLWRVIDIAMRKNATSEYQTSGAEARSNDLFLIYLVGRKDGKLRFVASSMEPLGLVGKWTSHGKNFKDDCCIPYGMLTEYRPYIEHHYGGWVFRIRSVPAFMMTYLVGYQFFKVRIDQFIQTRFNKQPLARRDRMKVLSHILDETVKNSDHRAQVTVILTYFYTIRWVSRPDHEELMTYYGLLLKSLVDSGDLQKVEIGYTLNPKALNSLAEYQQEERRHGDNLKIQKRIVWLTVALMAVGIAQAATGGFAAWTDFTKLSP